MADRWATFDCYGTLVDWNGGVRAELARLFGDENADRLLASYHEIERRVQAEQPALPYRDVLATVLAELAAEEEQELAEEERGALGDSLPGWPVFPEVPDALRAARERGWRLVILSNTDRDFIEASMSSIGVPFEFAIVASEIGSYKPAHGHWEAFWARSGIDKGRQLHVAASDFHDIGPANELGVRSIWINRLAERGRAQPDREQPDLTGLADTLDELLPAR